MSTDKLRLPQFRLSDAEVRDLISRAQAGDIAARDKMVEGNLRLVASIVGRYAPAGESEWEDLFQVGTIGLMKAIERFDLTLDVRFSTYAVPVILGEIRQYNRSNNPIKVGRTLQELASKAMRMREELSARLDREPTVTEVAAALEVETAQLVDALDSARPIASLFEPVAGNNEDSQFVLDRVKGADAPEDDGLLDSMALKAAMEVLNARERMVLELRYMKGLTQSAIAPRLGVSQVHVFRIEKAALLKVRQHMEGHA